MGHSCSAGYSVAAGEFSGDDEEGEGHIYIFTGQGTGVHGWVHSLVTPVHLSIIHLFVSQDATDEDSY